jgi:hypothetical protein
MSIWLVNATWIEDEAEASEQWEVISDTAHDAVKAVTTHLRFNPHHVEARLLPAGSELATPPSDLPPGEARGIQPR